MSELRIKQNKLIWIIAIFLISSALVNAITVNDGIIYYFGTNTNATNQTNSAGAYGDAQVIGSPQFVSSCVIGGCYNYTGTTNYLVTKQNISTLLQGSGARTISLWTKFETMTAFRGFFNYGADVNYQEVLLRIDGTGTKLNIAVFGFAADMGTLTLNTWQHQVVVYDGTKFLHYVNSVNVANWTPASGLNTGNSQLFIGEIRGLSSAQNEMIDEVGVWNRTLNQTEINQLYNNGTGYDPTTPTTNTAFAFNTSLIPTNNSNYAQNYMNFSINATLTNNTVNCSLILDGVNNETKQYTNRTSNLTYAFTITFDKTLSFTSHTGMISCKSLIDNTTTNTTTNTFNLVSNTYTITYNQNTTELNLENFTLNFTVQPQITNINATFYYNNTAYVPTKIINSNTISFLDNYFINFQNNNQTKQEFYWNYTIFYNDGTNVTNITTKNNQTILFNTNLYLVNFILNLTDLDYNVITLNTTYTNQTWITYNNVLYNLTQSGSIFSLINPIVVSNNSFYFTLNLSGILRNTTTYYQNFSIVNATYSTSCTNPMNLTAINLTFLNESNEVNINVSLNGFLTYWKNNNRSVTKNISLVGTSRNNHQICFSNLNQNLSYDLYFQYSAGSIFRYFIFNGSVYNSTNNLNVYGYDNIAGTSQVRGTVRDIITYNTLSNLIPVLQRYYPSQGIWKSVQMDKSDEFGAFSNIVIEQTVDYRFLFFDMNNNLIKQTNSTKFLCTPDNLGNKICEIVFLINPRSISGLVPNVVVSDSYNNVSKNLTISYVDTNLLISNARVVVTNELNNVQNIICDNTVNNYTGSSVCNLGSYTGTIKVRVYDYYSGNNQTVFTKYYTKLGDVLVSVLPEDERTIWGFGIALTSFMFGLFSPVSSVIGLFVGLVIIFMFNLSTPINLTILIISFIISIAIAIKVRR